MTKLLGLLGAITVASFGFVACTVTSDSTTSGTDGGSDGSSSSDSGKSDGSSGGDSSTGGDSGGGCELKASFGSTACDNCAQTNCCDKVNACADSADCIALNTCLVACDGADAGADAGDAGTACEDTCFAAHSASEQIFIEANSCVASSCSAQCN